jgi:hypothetical protein
VQRWGGPAPGSAPGEHATWLRMYCTCRHCSNRERSEEGLSEHLLLAVDNAVMGLLPGMLLHLQKILVFVEQPHTRSACSLHDQRHTPAVLH